MPTSNKDFVQQTILFAQEVGKDINELRKRVGSLSNLPTTDKTNIVNAIIELKKSLDEIGDATQQIPDWSADLSNKTPNI